MKKVTLIHCYSDLNYGDLGIMLSTIGLFEQNFKNILINGISTYNESDSRYVEHHENLRNGLKNSGGALFPGIFGIVDRSRNFVYFRSLINLIRFILLIPFVNNNVLSSFFLKKGEAESLKVLKDSDLIVSKGGSFFCDDYGKLGFLSFFRLWYIALIAIKLRKKVVILNQSLGPLNSPYSRFFGNYILKKMHKVVLREDECLKTYSYLYDRDYIINNDVVFYQNIFNVNKDFSKKGIVGITIKYVEKDKDKYQALMRNILMNLINRGFKIKVLPQVPLDGDIEASKDILNLLDPEFHDKVEIVEDFNNISKLIEEYSKLDFIVGTRLHSCIFSWSTLVPAINISYHGTKSFGIYKNLGIENFVINYSDPNSINQFHSLVDMLLENNFFMIKEINLKLIRDKQRMIETLQNILN